MVVSITTRRRIMRRGLYVLLGVLLVPTVGLVGDVVTDGKFKSTMSTGAPLEVTSDDMVANLNADMVDGVEGTDLYTKAEVDALVAAALSVAVRRSFYLTDSFWSGSMAASTACTSGYHMAAFFEISDPSNLDYAWELSAATTRADSGQGPPTEMWGWVRTGIYANTDDFPGAGNCNAWTSSSGSDYGTLVRLSSSWVDPSGGGAATPVAGMLWVTDATTCDDTLRVWCIED
jgi:hypothetical protein